MPLAIRRIKRAWQSIQYDTLAKHMDTYFDESENLLSECSTYSTPTLLQGMRRRERGEMGLLARFSHIFGSQREVWITFNVTEKFAKFYAFWVFHETAAASSHQPDHMNTDAGWTIRRSMWDMPISVKFMTAWENYLPTLRSPACVHTVHTASGHYT